MMLGAASACSTIDTHCTRAEAALRELDAALRRHHGLGYDSRTPADKQSSKLGRDRRSWQQAESQSNGEP